MIRKRLAALAAFAGLGLLSGCSSSGPMACNGQGPGFFSRLCGRVRTTTTVEAAPVYEMSSMPICDGPMLMDRGPVVLPSPMGAPAYPCAPGNPGNVPLAPVPRLVPEPQAQARPYVP